MGLGGVTMVVPAGAAPQIAGHILQLPRKLGRAAEIADVDVPTPGANYIAEVQKLLTRHPVLP